MQLPTTATAPFCPSEVRGTVKVPLRAPPARRLLRFLGPGLLVSVGYMDPGNWATDIQAGSKFGYGLLWVVVCSSLAAMWLQVLAARVGIATGRDLAQLCRDRYSRPVRLVLWLLAELAIVATDLAEVLGSALAFHLLLGVPLLWGVALTVLDTVIVLALQGQGFRSLESIVLGLIVTIGGCFMAELAFVGVSWGEALAGMRPSLELLAHPEGIALAVGIVGATVMPHNLYLHSSIVQTRQIEGGESARHLAVRLSSIDTIASLSIALFINAAILALAAQAFHSRGIFVAEIGDAYHLLEPLVGLSAASLLFGIALLASGQSSTFTGTVAGQVLLEGFLDLRIPCWQRRLITRGLALIPAFIGLAWLGDQGLGTLLVASQVVLSLQLPFAIWPMLRLAGDRRRMGSLVASRLALAGGWLIFALIAAGNVWLLVKG
ncbi:MAG TPA: Nramp family divalent metal transporter [Burkholderiaceae bacterium]|jgi:manganese transport protein|nr:Nramp family divalent metal transporter [Burkholderiaceae bacterium]